MTPHFVTETDEARWGDCTWAAAVMAIEHKTNGVMRPDREQLRIASHGDAASDGANMRQVVDGAKNMLGLTLEPWSPWGGARLTWANVMTELPRGAGFMLAGLYNHLPDYFRRWDTHFQGNHMVYIERLTSSGAIWWMDPLGRGNYRGEWISAGAAKRFGEALTDGSGHIYVAPFTPDQLPARETEMITFQRGNTFIQRALVRKGTKLLDSPKGGEVETLTADRWFDYAGFPNDEPDWRIVVWPIPMQSGGPALRGLFVNKTAITKFEGNPPATDATAKLANLKAKINELDALADAA